MGTKTKSSMRYRGSRSVMPPAAVIPDNVNSTGEDRTDGKSLKMRSDEFLKYVIEMGGPGDPESAAVVTRTVLDNLGRRLEVAEVADLAAQLPEELQEPLYRHGSEEPTRDDVDDFLRKIAEQLGQDVDPETAGTYVRAVLSTLGAAVSESEIDDLLSQLPTGFAPFFEE